MEWWMSLLIAVCGYLLGMAFAGSFLGRKWMGSVDVFLHRLLKKEVTTSKYLVWKHYYCIENPPKPKNLVHPSKLLDVILSKLV